jgi:nucleoside-diphosphate-sugar epimerase
MTVVVTGAGGNLGHKIVGSLKGRDWCRRIICLDRKGLDDSLYADPRIETVTTDVADPNRQDWQRAAAEADAIIHLAADPSPSCSWADGARSFDMTANLIAHIGHKPCRFIFASSNHAMGGYKEEKPGPGFIRMDTPPWPGTLFFDGENYVRGVAYGSTKLMGERIAVSKAASTGGVVTAVAMRIGWCLRAGQGPESVNAKGGSRQVGTGKRPIEEEQRDLRWFRLMWLSDRDFVAETEAALLADAGRWPAPGIVVNAVSANRGTPWNMEEAERWLGHKPQDDVWDRLGIAPE